MKKGKEAPEALKEVIESSTGFVLGDYTVKCSAHDKSWILIEHKHPRDAPPDRILAGKGFSLYEGSAEFRIPILLTEENMEKAYKVLHKFFQNPPDGVKLPKSAKLYNVAELLDKRPDMVNPELGSFTDQRGKGLCFYITWGAKGGVSLSADEYKNFILHMVKALHEGKVEGIGYYASIGPDRAFKKARDVATLPVFASYLDYVKYGVSEGGEEISFKGDENLFAFEPEFKKANFPNPLHDIVIMQKDLDKAGLTKEILLEIENEHKRYILRDFPKRYEKLYDLVRKKEKGLPDNNEEGDKSKLHSNYKALMDTCEGLFRMQMLPSDFFSGCSDREQVRLSNACKHLNVEAKEFAKLASPLIKKMLTGYKTNNTDKFADSVVKILEEIYPGLPDEWRQKIGESAKATFKTIKTQTEFSKKEDDVISALIDWFISLFGYGIEYRKSFEESSSLFTTTLMDLREKRDKGIEVPHDR